MGQDQRATTKISPPVLQAFIEGRCSYAKSTVLISNVFWKAKYNGGDTLAIVDAVVSYLPNTTSQPIVDRLLGEDTHD